MELDHRQLATVLAALRYWQQSVAVFNQLHDIVTYGDQINPLADDEIDALCEGLNASNLLDEKQLAYLASNGGKCPSCGSHDLDGGEIEIDTDGASQQISCNVCGSSWVDTYELTGFSGFQLED